MNKEERCTESNLVFDGKMIQVTVDTVLLPNQKQATREVVKHPGAVAILAETQDNQIILVKQYRYPCKTELLEIPAGKLDILGENPYHCALRELAEETPYTAQELELIYDFFTAPGFCDERMYFYHAKNISKNSQLDADEDEFIDTVLMNKTEVLLALKQQKIRDAKTIIALQYWLSLNKTT